ncbi:HutD family protein [Rhodobacter sp. KR11]|uniref:HutD/Ves family protein n=1 Tax=Rhodobacter sp. KR11 TaxID=2974588 RepID=UPI0022214F0A|nr:HutD family protein [Rhodobacter sp. KR11]MCW1919032.1 HutD family protein [Rhodobacter sp. KR11]
MIHLTAHDFRPMPWANGKGTTIELYRQETDHLQLRLSRAQVVEDGPFSLFPGIQRNLTVLTGPGFDLVGTTTFQARPLQPIAFPGDLVLRAINVTGPSEDFNVMRAAHLPAPRVRVTQGPAKGALLVLAAAPGFALYDLILTETEITLPVPVIEVS